MVKQRATSQNAGGKRPGSNHKHKKNKHKESRDLNRHHYPEVEDVSALSSEEFDSGSEEDGAFLVYALGALLA